MIYKSVYFHEFTSRWDAGFTSFVKVQYFIFSLSAFTSDPTEVKKLSANSLPCLAFTYLQFQHGILIKMRRVLVKLLDINMQQFEGIALFYHENVFLPVYVEKKEIRKIRRERNVSCTVSCDL